jgi:hypothetical protein
MSDVSGQPDYWNEARSPLASLCFLLPWLVIYEWGVFAAGVSDPDLVRNGADFWLRSLLVQAGAGQLLLPVLVLGILLFWHIAGRHPWSLQFSTQAGMLAESLLLAASLAALGRLHDFAFHWGSQFAERPLLNSLSPTLIRAVSFVGAGVYEEVMFRLLLVPLAFLFFRLFEFPRSLAAVMAAVSTSFLFALAHHVGPQADAFHLFSFSFRAVAGLFFACVFLLRGFGITVGCHAAYDLLVGILLTVPDDPSVT